MKHFFNSLRNRIAAVVLAAGIIPLIIVHFVSTGTYERTMIRRRTIELMQRCNIISTQLAGKENIAEAMTDNMVDDLLVYSDAYEGRLLVVDENFRIILDTYNADTGRICISSAVLTAFNGKTYETYQKDTGFIECVLPVVFSAGEEKSVTGALIFSSTTEWLQESFRQVRSGILLVEMILLAVIIVMAIYISYILALPIQRVAFQVEEVREGDTATDIGTLRSYREIDEIMDSTARVIKRYRDLEQNQEEFVSNVSHELRTPMTSIRVLADSLLGQKNIDEEIYQDFLSDISVEIDRESRIIDDLLSMARLGKASDSMNISTVNMNDLILELLKSIRPIAQTRQIELIYESFRQVNADVDAVKLNQAIANLVENAVKYNNDGGYVKVSLDADHEYFFLRVQDNGIGIPEDALDHIFDRFYRVDKARSRDTGGTGLGLSITKTIILLHYGIIRAESAPGEGTTFTIRIPLKHVRRGASS